MPSCGGAKFVAGMSQAAVLEVEPKGPAVFGRATLSPRAREGKFRQVSFLVGTEFPFDAPSVDWAFQASDGGPLWVVVAFEEHRVRSVSCATMKRREVQP